MNHTVTIERGNLEITATVRSRCIYKGAPMRLPSMSSPSEPPEPPEFDMDIVDKSAKNTETGQIEDFTLTDAEKEKIFDKAYELACEDLWENDHE